MITIIAEDDKVFLSSFANLQEFEKADLDENLLSLSELKYLLRAIESKRLRTDPTSLGILQSTITSRSSSGSLDQSLLLTKEDITNKTDTIVTGSSVLYPTTNAVVSYVSGATTSFITASSLTPYAFETSVQQLEQTKADTIHSHTISDVTGLESALENKLGLTSTATSATKLATPRTINGVNFDGTANITVSDSTKLPTTGGTINGDLTVTGTVTLNTVLPISSGGTGVTTLTDLKAALGVPQFIQITQEDYDSLGDIEKNDLLKLYFIVG